MVHEGNVFSKGLGRFGVILLESPRTSIFEMSSWKQTLNIGFTLWAHSGGSFPIAWEAGDCVAILCAQTTERRSLDSHPRWAANKVNVSEHVISSFDLIF